MELSCKETVMKRLGILAVSIAIAVCSLPLHAAAPAAAPQPTASAVGFLAPQPAAAGCPLYRACMQSIDRGCFCQGFFCNGQFICGVPVTLGAAASGSREAVAGFLGRTTCAS
jgi:hypothetical protein